MKLLWKVCGMRDRQNIENVLALKPDFLGFIFYPKSKRFVSDELDLSFYKDLNTEALKVGVFVNQDFGLVKEKVETHKLDFVQLHGSESPSYCKVMHESGISVIKAFSVDQDFDFETVKAYAVFCKYFLFDTKLKGGYGGHGKRFDWKLLEKYTGSVPFLLAGGISAENLEDLKEIRHPKFIGIDVNSQFETEPAFKDLDKLRNLKAFISSFSKP